MAARRAPWGRAAGSLPRGREDVGRTGDIVREDDQWRAKAERREPPWFACSRCGTISRDSDLHPLRLMGRLRNEPHNQTLERKPGCAVRGVNCAALAIRVFLADWALRHIGMSGGSSDAAFAFLCDRLVDFAEERFRFDSQVKMRR